MARLNKKPYPDIDSEITEFHYVEERKPSDESNGIRGNISTHSTTPFNKSYCFKNEAVNVYKKLMQAKKEEQKMNNYNKDNELRKNLIKSNNEKNNSNEEYKIVKSIQEIQDELGNCKRIPNITIKKQSVFDGKREENFLELYSDDIREKCKCGQHPKYPCCITAGKWIELVSKRSTPFNYMKTRFQYQVIYQFNLLESSRR